MDNINTNKYWDLRFRTGDWERNCGREQTHKFAKSQLKYFDIQANFNGSILDFGCGLGDAIPLYYSTYPLSKLYGLDISEYAIKLCKDKYGVLAEFICGDYTSVPKVDIIIASNVFEHLDKEKIIVRHLLNNCNTLYIIVPFAEQEHRSLEHIRTYNINSYEDFNIEKYIIFNSEGWSQTGWKELYYDTYFKNIIKLFLGKKIQYRRKQIMFKILSK